MDFDLYVPAEGAALAVDPKSAIVGSPSRQWLEDREARIDGRSPREVDRDRRDSQLVIDYEGNRYGAANMVTFADRAVHAADRHKAHYPTIARAMVTSKQLIRVARFNLDRHDVVLLPDDDAVGALLQWLDVDAQGLVDELRPTSIRALRAQV